VILDILCKAVLIIAVCALFVNCHEAQPATKAVPDIGFITFSATIKANRPFGWGQRWAAPQKDLMK
jgi:hypothetical protein